MGTKRNCPYRRSIETFRSHRRGAIKCYLRRGIRRSPYRCLDCDVRYNAFARFDDEASVNKKLA